MCKLLRNQEKTDRKCMEGGEPWPGLMHVWFGLVWLFNLMQKQKGTFVKPSTYQIRSYLLVLITLIHFIIYIPAYIMFE